MSAEREELARLVQQLPDEEVPHVLEEVRRHLRPLRERPWPPKWFGAAPGRHRDASECVDELLGNGFGR